MAYQPLSSLSSFKAPAPFASFTPAPKPVTPATPTPLVQKAPGVQAKAPAQNVPAPVNTLAPSMAKKITPTVAPVAPVIKPAPVAQVPAYAQPGYKSPGQIADEAAKNKQNAPQAPAAPAPVDTSRGGLLQSLVRTGQGGSPVASQAAQGLLDTSKANPALTGPAFDNYKNAVNALQDYQGQVSQRNADIVGTGADLAFKTGEQGALQSLAAQKQSQLQGAVNQYQTAIGQQIQGTQTQQSGFNQAGALGNQSQSIGLGAITSGIGARAPIDQFGVKIDPITGQPITGGSFNDIAAQGGKIAGTQSSAANLQTQIQSVQSQASAADANFSILNSYAKGIDAATPIESGLRQLYGTTAQGDEAVAGFRSQIQAVRAAFHAITGGDANAAIPDNITLTQLQQVQQALKSTAQNNVTGYQNQLNQLTNGGGSTSGNTGSGGTMFGSFFSK